LKRYLCAVLTAALAAFVRVLLDRYIGYHHPYAVFYVAVLISAWYGGLGPGLLAIAVGAAAAVGIAAGNPSGLEFYFIVSITAIILFQAQRKAERRSAMYANTARRRLENLERETEQRKSAEAAAYSAHEQLRLTFEHAPVGICRISLDGVVVEANPQFSSITGYSREELAGRPFHDPEFSNGFAGQRYSLLREGKLPFYRDDGQWRRKDGEIIWVEAAVSLVRGPAGQPHYAIGVIQDVTSRRRSEEQLREAQKLESVGLLAGGIAHDFNNLLTGVLGNASLAMDAIPADSAASRMLEAVISGAKRAADLTSQLLAYAGKGAFVKTDVRLPELVRGTLQLLHGSLPQSIEYRLELDEATPPVCADASQIQQLFLNLVLNAIEAIGNEQKGVISVSVDTLEFDCAHRPPQAAVGELTNGRYVRLKVQDSGEGIAPGVIPRIFDPFFTTRFMGRGLGLAAVSGIVRAQRGAVLVSSTPGAGSMFTVLFPAPAGSLA
jgi:PAS domain S-box-containing protein